jgi:hypothetical protein
LNTKIIFIAIILSILLLSSLFLLSNSEIRYGILQDVGIKLKPKIIDSSYTMEFVGSGLPAPYYLGSIGNDVFFNERFTGNLYVIKNGNFQDQPIINVSIENEQTQIMGIASGSSSIFIHVTEVDYEEEEDQFRNNRVLEYSWNGKNLNFIQEVTPQILFTDPHHSGGITMDEDENIFSTYPYIIEEHLFNYFAYGVHGMDHEITTNTIWHTSELDEVVDGAVVGIDGKIHSVSMDNIKNHKFWIVPYYPNSLHIPDTDSSNGHQNSIYVGFCQGKETKGGILKYPLNSQKTDFSISYTKENFKEIDHFKYLMAKDFYCVSDIEPGPEGSLFVTDYTKTGAIYKIVPKS